MAACLCVYVCLCVFACLCLHAFVCMYLCARVYTCVCVCTEECKTDNALQHVFIWKQRFDIWLKLPSTEPVHLCSILVVSSKMFPLNFATTYFLNGHQKSRSVSGAFQM